MFARAMATIALALGLVVAVAATPAPRQHLMSSANLPTLANAT